VTVSNPLLQPWTGPYGGVPPWDRLDPTHIPEAFEVALAERQREIDAIARNPDAPTFDNTVEALERTGRTLDRVSRLFSVARENVTTSAYQALAREWLPKITAAWDATTFNRALFARLEAVHAALPGTLDAEQQRLVTRLYDDFVRRGAKLDDHQAARLSAINQELATCFTEFREKVLADENTWILLEHEADLAGLPASQVAALRAAADERGLASGWAVINTRSMVDPFLATSTRRDLRQRVWTAFKRRGDNDDARDTKATIVRIVRLRAERARLLGFASHAHWRMADTMAGDPQAARALMERVWPAAVARVREEVADMQALAAQEGLHDPIEPWDYLYFAEKVRKARYDIDQAAIKPYFELNNMLAAAIWSAERRFRLAFTEITGTVPVFHPDVRVFEVTDTDTGRHRALFYLDTFARQGKRSGAWADSYRDQSHLEGETPLESNNNNFVKGTPGEPVLISLDDARTLFHEFGHTLHGLLQDIRYPGLAVTPRDFVEFPSQLNEEWLLTRDVLDRFARHAVTGEPMPQALVERIHDSHRFNQGYATVEYLAAAILDMDLHTRPDGIDDVAAFERETLARIGMPREVALRHRMTHFDHLFGSDAYSAGYYSYLWSEVMAADTWQAFLAAGSPWDETLVRGLRDHILSDGNTRDRTEAYRRFRGRDPDVEALIVRRGLAPAAAGESRATTA
jgi:peptidyl-dipeptidase Dcp